ncbi:MAG: hypothetical protein JWN66_4324 [Sphingomonas bacterium]|jgi:hypothetical protein|uniref:hypothetical protein n=1 Tax=Sphingomonas bacterium TaxID=1895847 RepID=UPI00260977E5|nr:hypothetical protein [Sphingomonas bacterium]MDB5707208.1 hypothetical protein [Sphingomonas bacterium]
MKHALRRMIAAAWLGLSLALAPAAAASATAASTDWRAEEPRALVITYRVAPAARIGFRQALRASLLPRLEKLRGTGDLLAYQVLANRYVDSGSWDVMAVLDFKGQEALARWRAVEDVAPAGLGPDALRQVTSAETAPGNILRAGGALRKAGDAAPVFLVIPYDYLVSTDDYLKYVDGYLLPQLDGWMEEGALSGFRLYLPRYAAGRTWSALLMLAYQGDAGLARRDLVTQKVRARLTATSAEWKAFADNKTNIRVEKQPIVADQILP